MHPPLAAPTSSTPPSDAATSTGWTPDFGGVGRPAPTWNPRRPLRIALLGDFGGGALAGRLETGDALARRRPLRVEFDTLEDALGRLGVSVTLPLGAGGAPVTVPVTQLESFHPDELYQRLDIFSALASLRRRLDDGATFAAAAAEMRDWGLEAGPAASLVALRSRARGATPAADARLDDFARRVGRAGPASGAAGTGTGTDTPASLAALLRRLVGPFVVPAVAPQRDALIAGVDRALADTLRAVLHQGDFQNLEALWRGADFLLRRLETGPALQVHLIDIGAEELAADLGGVADLADSGLYRLLVGQPAEDADGGYGYIAACHRFEATPPHVELLGRAARVAAHAGAPFITAIAPDTLTDRRAPPHPLVRQAFAALRQLPEASYLGLMAPRFLLRHPYGRRSDPIASFAFEEFTTTAGLRGLLWGHPALLAVSVLARPGDGLVVGDLPFHHVVDAAGDAIALPCTERLLDTDAALLLRDFGINAVLAHRGEPLVRLAGLQAVNGDGLAAPVGAPRPRPRPADIRTSIGAPGNEPQRAGWTPDTRGAAPEPGPRTDADRPPTATEGAADTATTRDAPVTDAARPTPPADRAPTPTATPATPPAEARGSATPAGATTSDPELDALLASLGDPVPGAGGAGDMDPELKALLDSLS